MYRFGMIMYVCVCVSTPDCRSMSVCVRIMLNTAWDLLLSSFMLVAATVRDLFPSDIRDLMSCHKCSRGKFKTPFCNTAAHSKNNTHLVAGNSQVRQTINIRPKNIVLSHSQGVSTSAESRRNE